eukprot:Em0017g56a
MQLDEEQFESNRVANEHDGDGDETTEAEDEERDGDGTTEEEDEERDGYKTAEEEDEERDGDGTTEEEDEERDGDGTTEEGEERDGYETADDEGSCGEDDPPDKSKADSDEADSDDSGSDGFGSGTHFSKQSNPEESIRNQCTPLGLIESDSAFAVSNDVTIAGATVSQFCNPRTRCYFKLVGDNTDKNVKSSICNQTTKPSLYITSKYMLLLTCRVDTSQSSNQTTIIWDPQGVNLQVLLPSIDDERIMKENFCTLISRVLVKHMKHLLFTLEQSILIPYDITILSGLLMTLISFFTSLWVKLVNMSTSLNLE